jgi:threonine dehydrogenase-like Zn-dependent dehydrogenase
MSSAAGRHHAAADRRPQGVEGFAPHRLLLEETPQGYEVFRKKEDGAIKVLP